MTNPSPSGHLMMAEDPALFAKSVLTCLTYQQG
jgi:hypothetical protein